MERNSWWRMEELGHQLSHTLYGVAPFQMLSPYLVPKGIKFFLLQIRSLKDFGLWRLAITVSSPRHYSAQYFIAGLGFEVIGNL